MLINCVLFAKFENETQLVNRSKFQAVLSFKDSKELESSSWVRVHDHSEVEFVGILDRVIQ